MTYRGLLKSFSELQKEFGLENKDFFRYLQIRDFYNKKIKLTLSREGNTVIDTLTGAYKKMNRKIISKIYQGL